MPEARYSNLAHWHAHIPRVTSTIDLRDWLTYRQSLTTRLTAHCDQFQVQLLHQHCAPCLADECEAMGLPGRTQAMERDVLLRCDGAAVVYAHTVLPLSADASQWPLFATLGNRSLGTTLFGDPMVRRGNLEFARLRSNHPLMLRIAAILGTAAQAPSLYARRSLFSRRGSSLLVTEVFLPAIHALRATAPTQPAAI